MPPIRFLFFMIFWLTGCSPLLSQLVIQVTSVPINTPTQDDIYIAGTFNNWDPEHPDYVLEDNGDGTYQISLSIVPGTIKFKFTRGGWDKVEGNAQGGFQPDHVVNYQGGFQEVALPILSWEDLGTGNSSAASNVFILTDSFYLAPLERYRRIWMYLPPDYEQSGDQYPVLYMHDGQNLFDLYTSFSGEWEVDESLNGLFAGGDPGIIVVGIENGGPLRIEEYTPWINTQYGGGRGEDYLKSIAHHLKPHIDSTFRTKPEASQTGLMGSSLGGLISYYGGLEYPEVFGKIGVFSPSFWWSDSVYHFTSEHITQQPLSLYFLGGEQESPTLIPNIQRIVDSLQLPGFDSLRYTLQTHVDGQHSEWYWSREFPDAYVWLFREVVTTLTQPKPAIAGFRVFPNPATDSIQVLLSERLPQNVYLVLLNTQGQTLHQLPVEGATKQILSTAHLPAGWYVVQLRAQGETLDSQKVIIQRP